MNLIDPKLIEEVREETVRRAGPEDALDFYTVAVAIGVNPGVADRIDTLLTERVMRSRGAI